MDNEKFLKEINRDLRTSKNELKNKSENVIKELNDYKKYLEDELDREKNKYSTKTQVPEDYKKLVYQDADNGGLLDFDEMGEEEYDIVSDVAMRDPMFALNFLERRQSEIPTERYNKMKEMLFNKLNIK